MENEKDLSNKEFKETAGMQFARAVKPAGCILLLLILIGVLYLCFTSGTDPIPGYEAPQGTEYYSEDGEEDSRVENGKLTVILENESFAVSRSAILRYYEEKLFDFQRADK